eukprot:527166-Pyramimonas_sp.AAC.1
MTEARQRLSDAKGISQKIQGQLADASEGEDEDEQPQCLDMRTHALLRADAAGAQLSSSRLFRCLSNAGPAVHGLEWGPIRRSATAIEGRKVSTVAATSK